MRKILPVLAILTLSCGAASAGGFSAPDAPSAMLLAQSGDVNSRSYTTDRPQRPQRYVCVVQPAQSDNRNRPYVCRANQGRVGESCRCSNVTGSGRLDLDD